MENVTAIIRYPLAFLLEGASVLLINSDNLISFGCIGLIVYILALILSKTTSCTVIWQWFDVVVTAIPGIIFLSMLYIYKTEDGGVLFQHIWINILFIISFISSMVLSIISNIRNSRLPFFILYILVSISAKLFIMILVPIFILLFIAAATYGETAKRTRSGRRGNKNIIAMAIVAGLAALLVVSLIKNNNNSISED